MITADDFNLLTSTDKAVIQNEKGLKSASPPPTAHVDHLTWLYEAGKTMLQITNSWNWYTVYSV